LSRCEKHGIYTTIDDCLHDLGLLALSHGDHKQAAELLNRRLALSLKRDRKGIIAASLLDLGDLDWELDDYDVAARKYETALGISNDIDSKQLELRSMFRIGQISLAQGEFRLAREHLDETLKLSKKLMYHTFKYKILESFAVLAFRTDEPERAGRLLGATNDWYIGWMFTRSPKERRQREQAVSEIRQALGEDAFTTAWEQGMAMTLEEAIAYALEGDERS
jgi:tetratricopeptide (TPR) repeat protein